MASAAAAAGGARPVLDPRGPELGWRRLARRARRWCRGRPGGRES